MKKALFLWSILVIASFFWGCQQQTVKESHVIIQEKQSHFQKKKEQKFLNDALATNTALSSIPLSEIYSGGPKKDEIPAIFDPNFIPLSEVNFLNEDDPGIFIEIEGEPRFYPYDILYWHEIINDSIGNESIAVTFCPLCGCAIVFNRKNKNGTFQFGVSGKLWESNLLMYDIETESLWSQVRGEAVVGERLGEKLTILESDVLTFRDVQRFYPEAKVLSQNTGYSRRYGSKPYNQYEQSEELMFPVQKSDSRFPSKELFYYAFNENNIFAFQKSRLFTEKIAVITTSKNVYTATVTKKNKIIVRDSQGNVLSGYTAMWLTWNTLSKKNKYIWQK